MEFLLALWTYIAISAPYLMIGLVLAGFLKQFVPLDKVQRWLGKNDLASVTRASLLGVPLPLCSCSVIPTAITLRKSGASKASTSAFLISTPESGVDSISVTYAMMDLPMTILRPVAAFFSAFMAGTLQLLFNNKPEPVPGQISLQDESPSSDEEKSCCGSGMKAKESKKPLFSQIKSSLGYGFGDLIDDISFWLGLGLILGAVLQVMLPEDFFQNLNPQTGRLLIILVAVPVYICASAATPIAASLILKGMSPGMALVLLLCGPAVNISNVMVLQKYIGKKGVAFNILAVVTVALAFSYLTDFLYFNFFTTDWAASALHEHEHLAWWNHFAGGVLAILIIKGIIKEKVLPWFEKKGEASCCG